MTENNVYDLVIIGAGVAGASAAMYAARLNLRTAMIAEQPGGLITTTHMVENWPGIKQISGADLAMQLIDHAMSYSVPLINEKVVTVVRAVIPQTEGKTGGYIVKTGSNEYRAKSILFATGTEHRKMNVPGEEEFKNRGVSYCALCDSGFYRGKTVAIVGSGDGAAKEAILLSEICAKVYLLIRKDRLKAEKPNADKLLSNPKIEIRYQTQITEVIGSNKVEKVKLNTGEELALDGIFVAIGHDALSSLAKTLGVELNKRGEIIINRNSETNLPGVYAAGDVTDSRFKQAITGASEAVTAAFNAHEYLGTTEVVFE